MQVKYTSGSWDPRCLRTRGFTFQDPFLWRLRWTNLGAPTAGNKRDEQYHGSCNGSKGYPISTSTSSTPIVALATPPTVASPFGTVTLTVLTPPGPSRSSPSAMTYKIRGVASQKKKKKKSRRIPMATTRNKKKYIYLGLSLTWPKSTRKERNNAVHY